ncbi:hypothetical protein PMEGAPL128_16970 [Priestia megaterium]
MLLKALITSSFTVGCHLEAVLKANYKVRLLFIVSPENMSSISLFLTCDLSFNHRIFFCT